MGRPPFQESPATAARVFSHPDREGFWSIKGENQHSWRPALSLSSVTQKLYPAYLAFPPVNFTPPPPHPAPPPSPSTALNHRSLQTKPFPGFNVSCLPGRSGHLEVGVGMGRSGDAGGCPHSFSLVFSIAFLVGAGSLRGSGDTASSVHPSRPTANGTCCC